MRIVKTVAVAALAASGLLAAGAAALAQPAAEVGASGPPAYEATAWHDVNVRICPSTACLPAAGSPVRAGTTVGAYCWAHGESITDYGYTNDVWLNIGRQDGGTQWSSAVYFVGDEYADLPADAECADVPTPPTTTRPAPTATPAPAPTATPAPTVTAAPTVSPVPTASPAPTATAVPTAAPAPAVLAPARG
ncbi:hypothetical protein ACFXGA_03740 [Actinosynnema sp. NPDC059335]|uniref:hypothetical protein n=1 Tax=Actinosynnema sp. NPDC059335 TaxID=3346804 RepID=UPI00366CA0D3